MLSLDSGLIYKNSCCCSLNLFALMTGQCYPIGREQSSCISLTTPISLPTQPSCRRPPPISAAYYSPSSRAECANCKHKYPLMQCHNHPWERAVAVAKSPAQGNGRETHTEGAGDAAAMLCSQAETREALGSSTVTGPQEGKEKRGFPAESWVTLTFPRSTCSGPGCVLQHKLKGNHCLLPEQ